MHVFGTHKPDLYGPLGDALGGGGGVANKQVFYSSVFPQIARIFQMMCILYAI